MSSSPRHRLLFALAAAFLLCAGLFLAGCKYSDVLTEHIEDPDIGVLDPDAEPIYQNVPGAPFDPDRIETRQDKSEDEQEQEQDKPEFEENSENDKDTEQREQSTTPDDANATKGNENGGNQDGTSVGEQELDANDAEQAGEAAGEAGGGGTIVVVDENGVASDVSTGTVAAVGEYATIAQMLGGAGGLVAADEAWLADMRACGAFAMQGDELAGVQAAFSGDGSEYGQANIDLLVNVVKPSVVLWDGQSPALTDEDRAALEAAGIVVQPVPTLNQPGTEDENIKQGVVEVAAILGEVGGGVGEFATAMCDYYIQFHDQTLLSCYNANGGYAFKAGTDPRLYQDVPLAGLDNFTEGRYTTVFVDSWWNPGVARADVVQYANTTSGEIRLIHDGQNLDSSDGVGLSASSNTDNYMLIDYYLQLAGVVNNAYDGVKLPTSGQRYIIMPGFTASFGTGGAFEQRGGSGSALFYCAGSDEGVAANWTEAGYPDFPAVLVNGEADEDIAGNIVNSAGKGDGVYNMEYPYQVYVVPIGISGNWAYGNVESFLLAPWALRIQNPDNLSAAASYAAQFYEVFYRCADWQSAVRNWDSAYTAQ